MEDEKNTEATTLDIAVKVETDATNEVGMQDVVGMNHFIIKEPFRFYIEDR